MRFPSLNYLGINFELKFWVIHCFEASIMMMTFSHTYSIRSKFTCNASLFSTFFLVGEASAWTWFLYSTNSSIYMYLVTLHRSSSMSDAGFLHKLFTKGLGQRVVIKWCMATAESRFQIFKSIFLKHSMKVWSDSLFSCRMLTKFTNVK